MLINPPTWTQNGKYTAEQDRQLIGALVRSEGVANTSSMVPTAISNSRQISIGAGGAYISGDFDNVGGGGMYFMYNDGSHEVAIPASGSLPRYDLVVLRIYDSAVSGSVNEARFEVVSGVPASNPRIPAVPYSSIAICAVRTPAGATSISSSYVSDQRVIAQRNGTISGAVTDTQETKLNQVASPSNPVLITNERSPESLLFSTGDGFQPVGSSRIVRGESDLPKGAPEGTLATSTFRGRTYQMRDGQWKHFAGWGPYITVGRGGNVTHTGPYLGGITVNPSIPGGWGDTSPLSSFDYASHFYTSKGSSGTSSPRAGGITFRTPGMYHVEIEYTVVGLRNGTAVRGGIDATGITQHTKVDNLVNRNYVDKNAELTVSSSGTVTVSNYADKNTYGKLVPYLSINTPATLRFFLMRVELQYEF